jgi:hypothetical protein
MQMYFPDHRRCVTTTAEDFEQPRCLVCNKRISDDRLDSGQAILYCSPRCAGTASALRRKGIPLDGTYQYDQLGFKTVHAGYKNNGRRKKVQK